MRNKPDRKGERLMEFLINEAFVFIKQTVPFPRLVKCAIASLNQGKKLSGEAPLPDLDLALRVLQKISPGCQHQSNKSLMRKSAMCQMMGRENRL
ncbi:MAG: hypothetical protein DME87_01685 [Verrucomicrobia bacterium]|nr:MAG: hypothetical protein DME87_01685 [Verrucomicrobiota bacterium]